MTNQSKKQKLYLLSEIIGEDQSQSVPIKMSYKRDKKTEIELHITHSAGLRDIPLLLDYLNNDTGL